MKYDFDLTQPIITHVFKTLFHNWFLTYPYACPDFIFYGAGFNLQMRIYKILARRNFQFGKFTAFIGLVYFFTYNPRLYILLDYLAFGQETRMADWPDADFGACCRNFLGDI